MYNKIIEDINQDGIQQPQNKEIVGYQINQEYLNINELMIDKVKFKKAYLDNGLDWEHKKMMELEHYKKLEGGLLHSMNESKYYTGEQLMESRKFVVTSSDCISVIQIIFRPEKIFCGVYFRSSRAKNLLPVDLDFIYGLVKKTLDHLKFRENTEDYREVTPELVHELNNKPIEINLNFGSLHK